MEVLYKRIDGELHYHEVFVAANCLVEYWGVVGHVGTMRETRIPLRRKRALVARALSQARSVGFEEISLDDQDVLLVVYTVDGFGTDADMSKRQLLQSRLADLLPTRGLGFCDGGSAGSGTMEACCFVVDFEITKGVIEADLAGTPFDDYSGIRREGA